MMSKFTDYINRLKEQGAGPGGAKLSRKKIWWLAALMALGVLLVIIGNIGNNNDLSGENKNPGEKIKVKAEPAAESAMVREEKDLAARLQEMLSDIEGAGRVKVTVKLAASSREDYAINTTTGSKTTQEKDQGGGTRTITENTGNNQLVLVRGDKGEAPVVEQEQSARVSGVLVVAEGAADPLVKADLFQAVRVSLGVEPQKILVLPAEKGV